FFIFVGGRRSKYYGLPSCIFSFAGVVALCKLTFTQKAIDKILKRLALSCGISLVLLAGFSMALSSNTPLMFKKKSDLPQFKFAKIIKEENPNATLLNYGSLDKGLYTVAEIVPTCKYFCGLNIQLPELTIEQNRYISEGKTDYVIAAAEPENIYDKYELISVASYKYEWKTRTYYLYGLKK
ncbi:MAG: hypothetical protein K2G38_01445, partial [Clostridia bacterium]|nr:hypothetical protein [Clostridia bacterium]